MRMIRLLATFILVFVATSAYSASKTVLVLGDSLSAEYGIVRGTGWVPLLEQRLKSEKIEARVINASISGDTTGGGRTRLPALLEQHQPTVVVIELGANDGMRGLPLTELEMNLRAMINASSNAKAKVLLVGMQLPPNYGKQYTEKFTDLYKRLSKEMGIALVPFLLEGFADQPQLFQPDRIHPTVQAQPIMLNNIWPKLKPLVAK